jgi:uncharacterized membrane protein (UPF0182 family)
MEPTLDEALNTLFGTQPATAQGPKAVTTGAATGAITPPQSGSGPARAQFEDAQKAMQQGDWDKFRKAMEALKHLLANPST